MCAFSSFLWIICSYQNDVDARYSSRLLFVAHVVSTGCVALPACFQLFHVCCIKCAYYNILNVIFMWPSRYHACRMFNESPHWSAQHFVTWHNLCMSEIKCCKWSARMYGMVCVSRCRARSGSRRWIMPWNADGSRMKAALKTMENNSIAVRMLGIWKVFVLRSMRTIYQNQMHNHKITVATFCVPLSLSLPFSFLLSLYFSYKKPIMRSSCSLYGYYWYIYKRKRIELIFWDWVFSVSLSICCRAISHYKRHTHNHTYGSKRKRCGAQSKSKKI